MAEGLADVDVDPTEVVAVNAAVALAVEGEASIVDPRAANSPR